MTALAPLADITNVRRMQSNIQAGCAPSVLRATSMESTTSTNQLSSEGFSPMSTMTSSSAFDFSMVPPSPMFTVPTPNANARPAAFQHDPYNWKCLPESDQQATMLLAQRASHFAATQRQRKSNAFHTATHHQHCARSVPRVGTETSQHNAQHQGPAPGPNVRILVQFKCHHGEFSSVVNVEKGQYVVVQGDRGMDIGVVIRVNTENQKTYVERTGPCGQVMRHATQREVDYWATELKNDEQAALDFCQRRVAGNDLVMEVRHAEYQFDKKKLTFYYDAKSRVDFVALLKDLYREFGCRIWMEKVRTAELAQQ